MLNICAIEKKKEKQLEEQQLIERALAGDHSAFAVLYYRYYNQIRAFCKKLLHGRFDVEDATQQVFLEAWRSLKRFEGRSLFSTWLTKIAIHTCLSFHRKCGRIVLHSSEENEQYEQHTDLLWGLKQQTPSCDILLKEKKSLVHKLLSRMTDKKKIVFMLSDMQGLSAPEISKMLKIPDATVRTRLFHARKEFAFWVNRNQCYREVLASD